MVSSLDENNATIERLRAECESLRLQHETLERAAHERAVEDGETSVAATQLRSRVAELEDALRRADARRRQLHNTLQEVRGNIRVVARVRPVLGRKETSCVAADADGCTITVQPPPQRGVDGSARASPPLSFTFDRAFGPTAAQASVFEEVGELVESAFDGYHVSILAYGATGSGKTFTMHGSAHEDESLDGIIPRATTALAREKTQREREGWQYTIDASAVEVYDERIYDLLALPSEKRGAAQQCPALELRSAALAGATGEAEFDRAFDDDGGPEIEGLTYWPVDPRKPAAIAKLVERAATVRTTRTTALNDRSSRSHAVFRLRVRGRRPGTLTLGSLVLVDLAGSERAARSGADAHSDQFREACSINRSLSCLVDVFTALGRKRDASKSNNKARVHIP